MTERTLEDVVKENNRLRALLKEKEALILQLDAEVTNQRIILKHQDAAIKEMNNAFKRRESENTRGGHDRLQPINYAGTARPAAKE